MHSCNFPLLSINNKNIHSTFWQLWDEHKDYLYHCCIKWMSNINDAEDVLDIAMLKAWNKISNCTVEIKDFKKNNVFLFTLIFVGNIGVTYNSHDLI